MCNCIEPEILHMLEIDLEVCVKCGEIVDKQKEEE